MSRCHFTNSAVPIQIVKIFPPDLMNCQADFCFTPDDVVVKNLFAKILTSSIDGVPTRFVIEQQILFVNSFLAAFICLYDFTLSYVLLRSWDPNPLVAVFAFMDI